MAHKFCFKNKRRALRKYRLHSERKNGFASVDFKFMFVPTFTRINPFPLLMCICIGHFHLYFPILLFPIDT